MQIQLFYRSEIHHNMQQNRYDYLIKNLKSDLVDTSENLVIKIRDDYDSELFITNNQQFNKVIQKAFEQKQNTLKLLIQNKKKCQSIRKEYSSKGVSTNSVMSYKFNPEPNSKVQSQNQMDINDNHQFDLQKVKEVEDSQQYSKILHKADSFALKNEQNQDQNEPQKHLYLSTQTQEIKKEKEIDQRYKTQSQKQKLNQKESQQQNQIQQNKQYDQIQNQIQNQGKKQRQNQISNQLQNQRQYKRQIQIQINLQNPVQNQIQDEIQNKKQRKRQRKRQNKIQNQRQNKILDQIQDQMQSRRQNLSQSPRKQLPIKKGSFTQYLPSNSLSEHIQLQSNSNKWSKPVQSKFQPLSKQKSLFIQQKQGTPKFRNIFYETKDQQLHQNYFKKQCQQKNNPIDSFILKSKPIRYQSQFKENQNKKIEFQQKQPKVQEQQLQKVNLQKINKTRKSQQLQFNQQTQNQNQNYLNQLLNQQVNYNDLQEIDFKRNNPQIIQFSQRLFIKYKLKRSYCLKIINQHRQLSNEQTQKIIEKKIQQIKKLNYNTFKKFKNFLQLFKNC